MILPSDRYRFNSQRPSRRPRSSRPLLIVILILAVIAGGYFALKGRVHLPVGKTTSKLTLSDLWQEQNYRQINAQADKVLATSPLDENALVYNGFAYFYESVAQPSLEKRIPILDEAIINLRKALLAKPSSLTPSIYYILGKSYYFKGKFYLDLAIKYLNKAVEDGYSGSDTYEYLGLAYSDLGEYDKAAALFQKAIAQRPSGLLLFILAQTYYKAGNNKSAEEYLLRSVNAARGTKDTAVEEQARFLLGKIYTDQKAYLKAEDQYKQILDLKPRSADAHYYLGDIYSLLNDNVKARAEWREALRIDPQHWGARLKLYK